MEGECQFVDDAPDLQQRLLEADVVVLATPVYFYSIPSQAKAFIDRAQSLWMKGHVLRQNVGQAGGRGVLICVGGSRGEKLFSGINLTVRYFMDTLGKNLAARLCFREVNDKRAILQHPTALDEAREMGRRFAADENYRVEEI